jgi:hypothetical protein
LLRELCPVAHGAAGLVQPVGDAEVVLLLSAIALYCLWRYLPVVCVGLPHAQSNQGPDDPDFVVGL